MEIDSNNKNAYMGLIVSLIRLEKNKKAMKEY